MTVSPQPCVTCPWRISSTAGGADIPNFSIVKMRNLSCTVGPGDGFRQVMACHGSDEGADTVCRGYVAQEGWSNLNVRLLAMDGAVDIAAVLDACADLDLWPDFESMLEAYEAAQAQEA